MNHIIRVNFNGILHDDDDPVWPFPDRDEEKPFSLSQTKSLVVGGFTQTMAVSEEVDNEVVIEARLDMRVDELGKLMIAGILELKEGDPYRKSVKVSVPIDYILIDANRSASIYEGKLSDDEGDWAQVRIEIFNESSIGTVTSALSLAELNQAKIDGEASKNTLVDNRKPSVRKKKRVIDDDDLPNPRVNRDRRRDE